MRRPRPSGDLHDYLSQHRISASRARTTAGRSGSSTSSSTPPSTWTRWRSSTSACRSPRDGSQPRELARTRSWHYSNYNLAAFGRLAAIGGHIGEDLWHYQGPQGQSLVKAVDLLLPAATGDQPWTLPELEFYRYAASDITHAAAEAGDRQAAQAVPKLEPLPAGNIWDLRPAPQHAF